MVRASSLLVLACLLAGGAPLPVQAGEPPPLSGYAPAIAPDFTRTDLQGHPVQLRALRGKLVLLNFWATWCEPCLEEVPRFSEWQQRYGVAGLRIVGVAMDDGPAPVRRFVTEHQVGYPVIMGDVALAESYGGVLGLPLSYLIDPQGSVVARYRGEPALAQLEERIQSLLPRP